MTNLQMKTNMTQLICMYDNDTKKDTYYIEKGNKWVKITQEEYNQIRGMQ